MKFVELRVQNVHFFKKVKFNFDYTGITAILGLNRDSKTEGVNTNGSGKSSLFATLIDVLTPEGTSISRKDKTRQGKVEFDFEQGPNKYTLVNTFGKSEKLDIVKNGTSLGIHTLADAKTRLLSITKKTITDYRVLDYLDVRVPHPLQLGSSTQRKDFFTKFFSLASKDYVKKLVKAELDDIKAKELLLKELQSNLKALRAEHDSIESDNKDYSKIIAKLESRIKSLESQSHYNDWCNTYRDELEEFAKWRKYTKADLEEKIATYSAQCEDQDEYKVHSLRYKAYLESVDSYNTSYKRWKDFDVELANAKLAKLKAKQQKALALIESYEAGLSKYRATKERLQDNIADLKSRLKKTSSTCPTCGTKLTDKEAARKHLQSELDSAESKLSKLERPDGDRPKDYKEEIRDLESELREYERLPKAPVKVAKPKPLDFDYDPHVKLSRVRSVLKLHKSVGSNPYAEKYYERGIESTTLLDSAKSDLYDAIKQQQYNESANERKQTLKTQAKALLVRIQELKDCLAEKEVLDILNQAYGTRSGVKELVIKSICDHLQKTVNKYATFIFPEPFTFEFDLSSSNFNITVSRPYKGKVVTSDVRKLSGAESSMFNMTLALSLLTFVPKALRSNILILDEIDANFSEEMERSLARFLPVLNKVIPHIILITPDSKKVYEGARYFTMVKQSGISNLVEGKVLR